jgi:histidinol phosphatase-like enzyme
MTEESLSAIHRHMQDKLEKNNARLDAIYYATTTDNKEILRKPNPGMAYQAKLDFPEIDFSRSIMIGNKPGDMRFGRHAGMYTVYLATTNPETPFPHPDIDLRFNSLPEFAAQL